MRLLWVALLAGLTASSVAAEPAPQQAGALPPLDSLRTGWLPVNHLRGTWSALKWSDTLPPMKEGDTLQLCTYAYAGGRAVAKSAEPCPDPPSGPTPVLPPGALVKRRDPASARRVPSGAWSTPATHGRQTVDWRIIAVLGALLAAAAVAFATLHEPGSRDKR